MTLSFTLQEKEEGLVCLSNWWPSGSFLASNLWHLLRTLHLDWSNFYDYLSVLILCLETWLFISKGNLQSPWKCLIQQYLGYSQLIYLTLKRIVVLHTRLLLQQCCHLIQQQHLYTVAHCLCLNALKSDKSADEQGWKVPACFSKGLWESSRKYLQFVFDTFFAAFWFYVREMKYKNPGTE